MKAVASALALVLMSFAISGQASPRIVTLTPHATELVFAAGAGHQIVATVSSSNYPVAAKDIERIGDGVNTSIEQVLAWSPDWVIGWPSPLMTQLETLGIQTWVSNPQSLESIGTEVLDMAQRLGDPDAAAAWHADYTARLMQLRPKAQTEMRVVLFASSDGQFVIGRHDLINETLGRCGATNPFAASAASAPLVSAESLIAVEADVMISGRPMDNIATLPQAIPLYVVDADKLYRPGPRFLDAALEICALLAKAKRQTK